ncbi:putative outer membrane starch-binding protein [Dyadobacter jejuensis]|uniref:Putative outer membrane starch-binding protein n=1 Tax=Dyadobacter jejuensis TaxID=1082580 RepID=A0A316A982_9BACT|nr:RagB/SusD family nutrient uptake outer membrane protein [Dyadobacter jejuensis]PWJ54072.1 putative outer membrane starch-binding protein [Dyadobacter jejuensis]
MKINKILLSSILTISLLAGCTNLEEDPKGLLAPESFFKSLSDVEAGIFGGYSQFVSQDLYGRELPLVLMLRSDMSAIGDLGTEAVRRQIDEFDMDSQNYISASVWEAFFRAISAANTTLAALPMVNGETEKKNSLEAEARFIRAFSYFNLIRLFGDVPYLNTPIETTTQLQGAVRTPVAEIYKSVEEDLLYAKLHLPSQHTGDVRNRATSGTAATVLADVYLTQRNFTDAATQARYVITNASGKYNYSLEKDYQNLFRGELASSLKEPIFVVDWQNNLLGAGNINLDWLISQTRPRGLLPRSLSVVVPTLKVYQSWDARDYRRAVSMDDSVMINGQKVSIIEAVTQVPVNRPHIAKYYRYPGPQDAGDDRRADNDYHIYRYADVLLMAAEAIAETEGATDEAIGYINLIRTRARFNGASNNSFPENVQAGIANEDFIHLVREERRLELAFEFKRWFDIQRWQNLSEVFTSADSYEPRNVDLQRDYLLPLPLNEIRLNGWEQNPGY